MEITSFQSQVWKLKNHYEVKVFKPINDDEEDLFQLQVMDLVNSDGDFEFNAWTRINKLEVWIRAQFHQMQSKIKEMNYSIISKQLIEILDMYKVLGSLNKLGQFIFSKFTNESSWSLTTIYIDLVHLEEEMGMKTKMPWTSLLLRDLLAY